MRKKRALLIWLTITMIMGIIFNFTSMNTISAYAATTVSSVNLALNKQAVESSHEGPFTASGAFDGNRDTRWSSLFSDPQWIYVDLETNYSVNGVKLDWETASAKSYKIQVSTDAVNWTDVYTNNNGTGGLENITFAPATARYVRMYGLTRNTEYGYSLFEFEVYGSAPMQQVSAPVITPPTGSYSAPQAVTMTTSTSGATIRYTTDGTTPTATSNIYTNAINVNSTTTIKAIATATGMTDSDISTAAYTFNSASGKSIPGTIEAENYDAMLNVQTEVCSEGGQNVGYIDTGDYMEYNITVPTTGVYTVQYRISSPSATGQIQLKNGDTILSTTTLPNTGGWQTWKTVQEAVNLNAGSQKLRLYASSGGFNINWIAFLLGAPTPQVATPTFTPAGGAYATAQDVTILCATSGATIKYTLDGSTPTASSQTYTTPIHIPATTSVKAIAMKDGMLTSELAGTAYKISSNKGVMDFIIKNGTRGNFSNDQIYWGVLGLNSDNKLCYLDDRGNLIPTTAALNDASGHLTKNGQNYANIYHKLSEVPMVSTPAISSGRMFLSIGSPCYIKVMDNGYAGPDINNITDPNNDVYWDFVEFTLDAGGYHGNTTRVDAFTFPITHRLICYDGYDRTVGETETRDQLFAEYKNEVPDEFKTLVQAPYRIVAPCKGTFKEGGIYGNYFDAYVNKYWHETTQKPTTQDILLGIGGASDPKICADLNRGVYMNPEYTNSPENFYKITPSNFYAKFWHDHSIDGLSYGFCYDDVHSYAAYLEHNDPAALIINIGW